MKQKKIKPYKPVNTKDESFENLQLKKEYLNRKSESFFRTRQINFFTFVFELLKKLVTTNTELYAILRVATRCVPFMYMLFYLLSNSEKKFIFALIHIIGI